MRRPRPQVIRNGMHHRVHRTPALFVLGFAILLTAAAAIHPARLPGQEPLGSRSVEASGLPLRWSAVIDAAPDFADPIFDRDGQFVILAGRNRLEAVVVNTRSGALRGELPAVDFQHDGEPPVPTEKGSIAFRAANRRDLLVWDLIDGKLTEIPHKFTKARSLISFSANGRYISVSRPRSIAPGKMALSPLDIMDTKSSRSVVSVEWQPGDVLYTADSTRALVVDANDRFQWIRLPSGKLDGEWKLDRDPSAPSPRVLSISDDGSALLYSGVPRDMERGLHLIDGKTGTILHSFPAMTFADTTGFVAPDGNSVALLRTDSSGSTISVDILDRTGALLGRARLPQPFMSIAVSWDARAVALYDRNLKKLWIHDLPGGSTAVVARPRERGPNAKTREWVPGEAGIAKAELMVRHALKTEYARKPAAERRALTEKLLTLAAKTNHDLAARYVMLRDARDIAVDIDDPSLALRAINELANGFQIDGPTQTLAALERIVTADADPAALRVLFDAAFSATGLALAADEFDDAVQFAQLGANAARKGKLGPTTTEEAEARLAHARKLRDSFDTVRPTLDALRTMPDDHAAHTAFGKFRCFVQGRWDDGVKHLAKGASAPLRAVAELDLKNLASGAPDVAVADAWWDYGRSAPDDERWGALGRARYWYSRSIPGLSGPNKTRAEIRLAITSGGTEYRPGLLCEISSRQPALLKGKRARIEPVIDFSGSEFADGGRQTDLTVKWTGAIAPPLAGHYGISALTGDPVRVRLDGRIVIDTFSSRSARRDAQVVLSERPVPISVEFTGANTDRHRIKLKWTRPGESSPEAVPAEYLFHDKRGETVLGKSSP
jgi:PA14 domain